MALNIAVPLSGVGGLSPISPIGLDCWENIKILVSPIGSESSGVSSLDSEEAKIHQNALSNNDNDNNNHTKRNEHLAESSPIKPTKDNENNDKDIIPPNDINNKEIVNDEHDLLQKTHEFELKQLQEKPLQPMLLSSSPPKNITINNNNLNIININNIDNDLNNLINLNNNDNLNIINNNNNTKLQKDLKIMYNGRDILDLGTNIIYKNKKLWNFKFTYLPENNNIPMFLANRSQYHRLGVNGHIQEYTLKKCDNCDYQYPVDCVSSYFCQTSLTYTTSVTTTPALYVKNLNSISAINKMTNNNNNNSTIKTSTTTTNSFNQPKCSPSTDFSVNLNNFLKYYLQLEHQEQNPFQFGFNNQPPPPLPPPQQQQQQHQQQQQANYNNATAVQQLTATAISAASSALSSPISTQQNQQKLWPSINGNSPISSSGYNSSGSRITVSDAFAPTTATNNTNKYQTQQQLQQNFIKNLNANQHQQQQQQQQQKISPTTNNIGGNGNNINGLNNSFYSFLNSFTAANNNGTNNTNNNGINSNYWNNGPLNTTNNNNNNNNSFFNQIAVGGGNLQGNNLQNCGQQQQNYARMYKYF